MEIGPYVEYFSEIYHGLVWGNGQYFDGIVFLGYQQSLLYNRKLGSMN
jgi:hypothetical protein